MYDFVHKFKHKLAQAGIVNDAERLVLLKSKLEGRAYTASRLHASEFATFVQGLEFLQKTYAPTAAAIQAQL